jgi:hypothetical protein
MEAKLRFGAIVCCFPSLFQSQSKKSASFTSDEVELYHGKTAQPEKLKISEIKLYDFHNKHYITLGPLDTLIDSTRPLVMGSEARFF